MHSITNNKKKILEAQYMAGSTILGIRGTAVDESEKDSWPSQTYILVERPSQ